MILEMTIGAVDQSPTYMSVAWTYVTGEADVTPRVTVAAATRSLSAAVPARTLNVTAKDAT